MMAQHDDSSHGHRKCLVLCCNSMETQKYIIAENYGGTMCCSLKYTEFLYSIMDQPYGN